MKSLGIGVHFPSSLEKPMRRLGLVRGAMSERNGWSHFATTSAFTRLSFSKSKLLQDGGDPLSVTPTQAGGGVKTVCICNLALQRRYEPLYFHFPLPLTKPMCRLGLV